MLAIHSTLFQFRVSIHLFPYCLNYDLYFQLFWQLFFFSLLVLLFTITPYSIDSHIKVTTSLGYVENNIYTPSCHNWAAVQRTENNLLFFTISILLLFYHF